MVGIALGVGAGEGETPSPQKEAMPGYDVLAVERGSLPKLGAFQWKTLMWPHSATGSTDENSEGRQPLVCRVWEHTNLNPVSDSNVISM